MATRVSFAKIQRIVALARQNLHCVEIGRRVGVSKQAVYRALAVARELDPTVPMPSRRRPRPRKDLIVSLKRQGASSGEIARQLRMPKETVRGVLTRARREDPTIPVTPQRAGREAGGWSRMAVEDQIKDRLAAAARERHTTPARLLNQALAALLAEPVVLDNLLDEHA